MKRGMKHQNAPYLSAVNVQKLKLRRDITPPARRAWRSYKFASLDFSVFFFFFFSVSKVGLPLMGYTAVHSCLSHYF